jgi:hypothetical protein
MGARTALLCGRSRVRPGRAVLYSPCSMDAYHRLRDRARQLFDDSPLVTCPYFAEPIVLNGEGLHHLRYSADRERGKPEQMLKFRLFRSRLRSSASPAWCRNIGAFGKQ